MRKQIAAILIASALAGGCATEMPAHQSTFDNVVLLRGSEIPPLALGEFRLAPGMPAQIDTSISIRADSLKPTAGTFSQRLRQTLEAELSGAGKLDPNAGMILSGDLNRSEVSTGLPTGQAALGARFRLTHASGILFDQDVIAVEQWESSFFGAEAIPDAMNRYSGLYAKLVALLFRDPAFQAALQRR